MYHNYNKSSSYLRNALYKEYNGKCEYCGIMLGQPRYMHVDHILPTNKPDFIDEEVVNYLKELENEGFIQDSIENYLPACSSCNIKKNNQLFTVSSLRYYHEIARKHTNSILHRIEKEKKGTEFFYEPVDLSIWKQLNYSNQRDISYAIMGYRLTDADTKACPEFPLVKKVIKQLDIVDYATILGETGCGKSISLYQTGYYYFKKGWQVYLLIDYENVREILLPDNTENSLFLIDDAQIYSEILIKKLCDQSRRNRKVLFAKTISEIISTDSIIQTNEDAVSMLYFEFLNRKNEIWPIVKKCDNSVGVNMMDISIERRLESAKKAKTPWQFTYILRGGWNTMRDLYLSIIGHENSDLLVATIAVFQILKFDKPLELNYINQLYELCDLGYHWEKANIDYLVKKKIVLSEDEIRIVHLESANEIVALFFDCKKSEKQIALISVIENEFKNKRVLPLGIVWLCNGCRRALKHYWGSEEIFITKTIIDNTNNYISNMSTSEEIRNTLYLLDKIIVTKQKEGLEIVNKNLDRLLICINIVDSVSAWGIQKLFNTLYNYDKNLYQRLSNKVGWQSLMLRMMEEKTPDYYSWGNLFNRGLSLLKKSYYLRYCDEMYAVMKWVVSKSNIDNIEQITGFLCLVCFFAFEKIHDLMVELTPVYKRYFETNIEKAINLIDFEFLSYLCGVGFFNKHTPLEGQIKTAKMIVQIVPIYKFAKAISKSDIRDWESVKNVLYLIYMYDKKKYNDIISKVNLEELSTTTRYSWEHSYEICLILECLQKADNYYAKKFLNMNRDKIKCYYSPMVTVDTIGAINAHIKQDIPLDLFVDNWWIDSLKALKALAKADIVFTKDYLDKTTDQIAIVYSDVTALDFTEKYPIDILKLIQKISSVAYERIIRNVDKKKVLLRWGQCGGINMRKKRWVDKRKTEFFHILGI